MSLCKQNFRSSYPKQNVSSTLLFLFLVVLRVLLCAGFILSVFWTGVHVCTPDMFAWNLVMVGLNLLHAAVLTYRFLPPALSVELTELYVRMFKPLKVSSTLSREDGQFMTISGKENTHTFCSIVELDRFGFPMYNQMFRSRLRCFIILILTVQIYFSYYFIFQKTFRL